MKAAVELDVLDRPATGPVELNAGNELVQAVEELRRLPKGERKQRAEELLRALMGTVSEVMDAEPEQPDTQAEATNEAAPSSTDEPVIPFNLELAPPVERGDETLDVALDALEAKIETYLGSSPNEAPHVAPGSELGGFPYSTDSDATPIFVEPEPAPVQATPTSPAVDQIDLLASAAAAAPEVRDAEIETALAEPIGKTSQVAPDLIAVPSDASTAVTDATLPFSGPELAPVESAAEVMDTEIETSMGALTGEETQGAPEPIPFAVLSEASTAGSDEALTLSNPEATPVEPAATPPATIEAVTINPEAPLDFSTLDVVLQQEPIAVASQPASDEVSPSLPTATPEHREAEANATASSVQATSVDQGALDEILGSPESAMTEPHAEDEVFSDSELLPLPASVVAAVAARREDTELPVRKRFASIAGRPVSEPYPIPQFLSTKCESPARKRLSSMVVFHAMAAAILLVVVGVLVYAWNPLDIAGAARAALVSSTQTEAPADAAAPALALTEPDRAVIADASNHSGGAMLLDDPPIEVRPAALTLPALPAEPTKSPAPEAVGSTESAPAIPAVPAAPAAPAASASVTPTPTAPTSIAALPVPSGDFEALVKRGDDLLKTGDVMAARSAYERPAFGGDAAAAVGMGQTYDPLFLAQLGARGMRGDPVQAAYWYARARDAGNREGERKLRALFSGIQKCVIAQGNCPGPGRKG